MKRARAELDFREQVRTWVGVFGGEDALRMALGRAPNYLSKISEAMAGKKPIHASWINVLRKDAKAGPLVRAYERRQAEEADPEIDLATFEPLLVKVALADEKMTRALLPDVLRLMGVREEDVARGKRAIEQRYGLLKGWLDR
jgi:hypothetical protein